MRTLALLLLVAVAGIGCSQKTPEQIEADKYPQVKVNTPEEEKAMRERLHLGAPTGADRQPPPK